MELVSALRIVDETVMYKHINADSIRDFEFDVLCLGEDHTGERFDKIIEWCHEHGKEIVRLKRTPGVCSTELRADVKERLM